MRPGTRATLWLRMTPHTKSSSNNFRKIIRIWFETPRCVKRLLDSLSDPLKRQGEDMKTSIVQGVFLFAAGVVCASVVAAMNPKVREEPMTPKLFEQRAQRLLVELADLGRYAGPIKDGRWGIYQLPADACITPPQPTVSPPGGPSRQSDQPGRSERISAVVRPSYSP